MRLQDDPWLSERLGRPARTVREVEDLGEPLPEDLAPGFYQARVPAQRVDVVRELAGRGFHVVNAGLTLRRAPERRDPEPGAPEIRVADAERDAAVVDIGATAFSRDRFHLDPDIPDAVADRIKRDWVGSYVAGERGEELLVADGGAEPAGFLAVLELVDDGRRVRVIDLVAVRRERRGEGAGRALVHRCMHDAAGRCDEVRVGTQAANPEATRFYERLGFELASSSYDLHLHAGTAA